MCIADPVRRCALTLASIVCCCAAAADPESPAAGPGRGEPASASQVAAWNLSIYPDGRGLPAGAGTAQAGRSVYRSKCANCHGAEGEGGSGGHLAGRGSLSDPDPDQTVGNYWPYATTLFDFIRRSMPMDSPGTLSDDEIYSVSAYVLYLNRIVGLDDTLDAGSLASIRMPNRDGFIGIDAKPPEVPAAPAAGGR